MRRIAFIGFLPLVAIIPHWIRVLRCSPVDRSNLSLWGTLAVVALVVAVIKSRQAEKVPDSRMVWGRYVYFLLSFVLFVVGFVLGIWLISMAAAVACAWFALVAGLGWKRAFRFAPAFVALLLAVPGVLFWGSRAGSVFAGGTKPACELKLTLKDFQQQKLIARKAAVSGGDRALFLTSHLNNWDLIVDEAFIKVSEVTLGDNKHEIHPPTFCLKSQGYSVLSEKNCTCGDIEVSESVAASMGRRIVVWTWYTSESESTASFIRFRMKSEAGWKRYTLMAADGGAATRKAFEKLISLLR